MLVRSILCVAFSIALFSIIGCSGQSSNSSTAGGSMDDDPFADTSVTAYSSRPEAAPKVAKSDVRRTKTHPQNRNQEPLPRNVPGSYGMVDDRGRARSARPPRSTSFTPQSSRPAQAKREHPIVALIGQTAPNIDVSMMGGGQINLVRHRSADILVVVLWASYNHLCQKELQVLKTAVGRFSNEQAQLIAVNDGENTERIKAYLEKNLLDLEVGVDLDQKVADAFQVRQLPFVAIIDKEGIVQGIHVGYIESLGKDIIQDLDALVTGKSIIEKSKNRLSQQLSSARSRVPVIPDKRAIVRNANPRTQNGSGPTRPL